MSQDVSIRRAIHQAVRDLPGGAVSVSAYLGIQAQDLRNRLSESCKDRHHLNLRHIEDIIDLTGDERIAQAVAAMFNGVFLPQPNFDELPDDGALLDDMLQVMDSVGTYGRELRQSLSDGDIDAGEWHKLNMCMQDIFRAVHLVQARAAEFRSDVEGEA